MLRDNFYFTEMRLIKNEDETVSVLRTTRFLSGESEAEIIQTLEVENAGL